MHSQPLEMHLQTPGCLNRQRTCQKLLISSSGRGLPRPTGAKKLVRLRGSPKWMKTHPVPSAKGGGGPRARSYYSTGIFFRLSVEPAGVLFKAVPSYSNFWMEGFVLWWDLRRALAEHNVLGLAPSFEQYADRPTPSGTIGSRQTRSQSKGLQRLDLPLRWHR